MQTRAFWKSAIYTRIDKGDMDVSRATLLHGRTIWNIYMRLHMIETWAKYAALLKDPRNMHNSSQTNKLINQSSLIRPA